MYDRTDVETYLPAVWEPGYWTHPPQKKQKASIDPANWRVMRTLPCSRWHKDCTNRDWCRKRVENAAEAVLRTATTDPKRSNSVWASLIDVKWAWAAAPLTDKERRALFLAYGLIPGLRFTQKEIAFNQGVSQQMVSKRIEAAITKVVATLNGDDPEDDEEAPE